MPSKPYIRPSVPRRLHALSGSLGPGLHVISVPDTSQASLTAIFDLTSLVRIQSESVVSLQRQMDTVLRTVRPQHLRTMSVQTPQVSANTVAQVFDAAVCAGGCGSGQLNQTFLLAFRLGAPDDAA